MTKLWSYTLYGPGGTVAVTRCGTCSCVLSVMSVSRVGIRWQYTEIARGSGAQVTEKRGDNGNITPDVAHTTPLYTVPHTVASLAIELQ